MDMDIDIDMHMCMHMHMQHAEEAALCVARSPEGREAAERVRRRS